MCRTWCDAKTASIGYTTSMAVREIRVPSRGMQQTAVHMVSVMSKWIDAEWLLNFFEPYPNDYQTPLGSLRACVDDAPSIEIIRCKECKYYEAKEDWCYWRDEAITADDFCSYGERKNDA